MYNLIRFGLIGLIFIMLSGCVHRDTTAPVITINGENNITIFQYDIYQEEGASAVDDVDGKIDVSIDGNVNTKIIGIYTIAYVAKDSAGNKASLTRTVHVIEKSSQDMLEELRDILEDDSTPFTTESEFNQTEYSKHHLPDDESQRLERAHMLVATAKDPDPEWFSTKIDKQVIIAKAGEEYTLHLDKVRKDGTVIGAVDNAKLRLVARIQRTKDDFEYITNVNMDQYAQWDGEGILKIHVPDNLDKGRLIVGIRPNFDDVATTAIAERWSTFVMAEVWNAKPNVKTLESSSVLFPLQNNGNIELSSQSLFSEEEIGDKIKNKLQNEGVVSLALVVKKEILKNGDLLSYMFNGEPYAGRVIDVEKRGEQQLALMTPEIFSVYEVTGGNNGFLINQGIAPEHVVYREGEALVTDINESDPVRFNKILQKSQKKTEDSFFFQDCTNGASVLTFEPIFGLSPSNIGIEFRIQTSREKVECTWKANIGKFKKFNDLIKRTGGPLQFIVDKLFGAGVELKPIGEGKIVAEHAPGFGLNAGWTYRKGGYTKILTTMGTVANLGSRDISTEIKRSEAKAETNFELGMEFKLKALSSDAGIGKFLEKFHIEVANIGISAKTGVKTAVAVLGRNAAEIYYDTDKQSSKFAATVSLDGRMKATNDFATMMKTMLGDSWVDFEENILLLPPLKSEATHTYTTVTDDGQGTASVNGLTLENFVAYMILPKSSSLGVLSLDNSSVFNDPSEGINYDPEECAENDPEYKITSPAIGCSGWMCGMVTKDVELCKGRLTISKVLAHARVNNVASGTGRVVNKTGDATVNVSGSPLIPTKTSLDMANNSEQNVQFSKQCPSTPGVYRENSIVQVEGTLFQDDAENIMVCHNDENKGDPHIVTGDGLGYDFFASGDYILSRVKDITGYEIQARFLPGYKTSWPQAVALRVGSDIVEIQGVRTGGHGSDSGVPINALSVWINGEKSYLGTSQHWRWGFDSSIAYVITLPSGGILAVTDTTSSNVLTYPSSITVIWPESSQTEKYGVVLSVTDAGRPSYKYENGRWVAHGLTDPFVQMQIARPDDFAGEEEGLLGNNDGDPKNDFMRRNGQLLGQDHNLSFTELYALFGTDWLVRPYESLFRNPEAIKPEFPQGLVELTPEQREFGEEACRGLTGFYYNACVMDVGLSGSPGLVQEYYADTDDLNELSDNIVTPDVDRPRYDMVGGPVVYQEPAKLNYTQQLDIQHKSGIGKFMLLTRAPRGGSVVLDSGTKSFVGEGNFTTSIAVNCTDTNSETLDELFPLVGAVQLWAQDPLSGTPSHLYSEVLLPCIDEDYQPTFVDNSTFPTTIEGSALEDGAYTFNVDVVDSKYGDYGFTTEIYMGHPSNGNKVSDTKSYTHDFRNEKSFYLYYVVTTPYGHSKIFYKYIRLINYELVDNTNFPSEIDYKDLTDLTYTFETNVSTALDGNVITEMYMNNLTSGNKVSETNIYIHDFRNEKSFTLYYKVTSPSGISQTFSKMIQLVNYQPSFVDNSSFPTEVEYNTLNDYYYTFKVDVNDSSGRFKDLKTRVYIGYPSDENKVSDTNIYTHDFRNEKSFNLYYVVSTSLGYSQTFNKSIRLVNYQSNFIDNSDFPVNIEYADLEDFLYTFKIDVNDSLGYEDSLTTSIYLGSIHPDYKVSDTIEYTHDFRNEKSFNLHYVVSTPVGYSKSFSKYIRLRNYDPVLNEEFSLDATSYLNKNVTLELDVEDPADKPLSYVWFVNGTLIDGDENELDYTFNNVGKYTIKCVVSNEIGGVLEISKTTNVIEGVKIIDISEIKNKTLMGNYTFIVKAADVLGADINYSWVVNGQEKSTSSTLNLSLLEDGQIVTITCIASSIHGSETYERTTKVYYPVPIIQTPLEDIVMKINDMHSFQIKAINQDEVSEDFLHYAWYIDGTLVSEDGEFIYTQADDHEHSLKCKVSNKYKSSTTEARIRNTPLRNFIIQTLEGNKVHIYDDKMSIVKSFDVNESGEVVLDTLESKINVSSVFTDKTVLTPLLFSRIALYGVYNSNHILDNQRVSTRHINANVSSYGLSYNYPGLYEGGEGMGEVYISDLLAWNINNDGYLDSDEIYAFGLSKYDINHDNKIQVNELKTYDDQNISMKFSFVGKHFKADMIDLGETIFIDTFKKFSDDSPIDILYPEDEYIDMNLTIINIPVSFENRLSSIFKSTGNEVTLLEYSENSLNNTLTGMFNLKIHHPEQEDEKVSFVIHDISSEYYGGINKSYFADKIHSDNNISLDYLFFTEQIALDFGRVEGDIVTKVDNSFISTGGVAKYSWEKSFVDNNSLKYGTFFNLKSETNLDWDSYELSSIFMFQEVFQIEEGGMINEQYLSLEIEDNGIGNEILGDDIIFLDMVRHNYYQPRDSSSYNSYYYILIEDTNIESFRFLNNSACQEMFRETFCEGLDLEDSWKNTSEIQIIDFKDDVNQSLKAPHRMKTLVKQERAG